MKDETTDNPRVEKEHEQLEQEMDPWKEFRQQFRGIHVLKDAERLLKLMKALEAKKEEISSEISSLQEQDTYDNPLEELAAKSRLDKLEKRVSWIDDRIQIIEKRAEELVKESQITGETSPDSGNQHE